MSSRSPKKPSASQGAAETGRTSTDSSSAGWKQYRREIQFLVVFLVLLGGGFTLLSLNSVNDHVIVPFTAQIAKVSAALLNLIGQDVQLRGSAIYGPRFAVEILNGCNGVETVVIFASAVLAFPAPWRARLIGLVLGVVAIQLLNLVRVIALFLTGSYFPAFFNSSHTVVWQSIVVLFGVLLWIFWANRFADPRRPEPATSGS